MDTENTSTNVGPTEMTPLELNKITLDIHHTILTPDYLENLKSATDASPQ